MAFISTDFMFVCYLFIEQAKPVKIILGFSTSNEDFGMMLYNKNRLIKAYERVGYQKQVGACNGSLTHPLLSPHFSIPSFFPTFLARTPPTCCCLT